MVGDTGFEPVTRWTWQLARATVWALRRSPSICRRWDWGPAGGADWERPGLFRDMMTGIRSPTTRPAASRHATPEATFAQVSLQWFSSLRSSRQFILQLERAGMSGIPAVRDAPAVV